MFYLEGFTLTLKLTFTRFASVYFELSISRLGILSLLRKSII
jgi:hypothetical protein